MGISVAMVGTGAFAQGFIPLFQAHPLVERIALCDLDAEKLARNKARHGIAESFASLDEVCASDFDAAVIITQQWLHGPQAVQALRAGKHAWSAVPAGRTLEECRALVQAVEEIGRIYMLAETSYYYPAVIYCRRRHAEGAFGRIVYAECEYYHDWDHGLYAVARWRAGDRWRWTAGAPPMYYPTHSTSQIMSVSAEDWLDLSDLLTCRTAPAHSNSEMAAVTSRDGTHLGAAPIHPVERLPRAFAGLPNGHAGSHQFLVDDFVRSCYEGTQPPNHAWNAVAYTVPGIVAHESALRGGELLEIPYLGAPPG